MKKIIILTILAASAASSLLAQDKYEFNLKSNELNKKEIILKGPFSTDMVNIMLGVRWNELDNKLQLVFDRKAVSDNDASFILFPVLKKKQSIGGVADCKTRKKPLWTNKKGSEVKTMAYFLSSDNLVISEFSNCYRLLANNNIEEFYFEVKNIEKEFSITLNGLFVAKTQKKAWYSFSSRDKKIEYKVNPITIIIRLEQVKRPATASCEMAAQVVPYIKAVQEIMIADSKELLDAQKNQSCTLFDLIKDKIRRTFVQTNDKCERYTSCSEISSAIKEYNGMVEKFLNEECKAAAVSSDCSLSENELSSINTRLRNLQMKINVKKKESGTTTEEFKDYQAIKIAVNAKLTPECRRKLKNQVDAYNNYCKVIESLF